LINNSRVHNHDLITKGVFPSTLVAPSSSRALLGTHWFQVYTAVIFVLCTDVGVVVEKEEENVCDGMNLIECITLKETLMTELFVASHLILLLLFVDDSHD